MNEAKRGGGEDGLGGGGMKSGRIKTSAPYMRLGCWTLPVLIKHPQSRTIAFTGVAHMSTNSQRLALHCPFEEGCIVGLTLYARKSLQSSAKSIACGRTLCTLLT